MLESKPDTVGRAIEKTEVIITNHEGNECLPHKFGQITVIGPGVMKGYYKNQELTEKTIKNQMLFTGDVGYKDLEGDIFVIGRKDNMFICAGRNIYPEEIEEVLMQTGVFRGVLIQREYDEKIIAYAEPKMLNIDMKSVLNVCKMNLEDYKIPHRIHLVDKLDRTVNGKIIRKSQK